MKFFRYVLMNQAGGGAGGGASAGGTAGAGGASAGSGAGGSAAGSGAAGGGSNAGASGANGASAGNGNAGANPTAAASGSGGTGASNGGSASGDWTTGLNDDFKGFVQNKGWKDPGQVVDSYRNLEKLLGAPRDQVIQLPKGDDDAAGWESLFTRLGRPATPDGYKLEVPKEGGDPAFAKVASETFHKLGLSEKQGRELTNWWNGLQQSTATAQKEAYQAKVTQDTNALKKEWGAAYDSQIATAQRAAREFGVKPEVINAIEASVGFAETMKFFNSLGSRIGESRFHSGNQTSGQGGPMTPAQAKARISDLKADRAWAKRYLEGDLSARKELETLHQYAHPEIA